MAKSIPTGTRDVLPDEMRELRAIEASLTELFEREGYGEVQTPALEYEEPLPVTSGRAAPGATGAALRPAPRACARRGCGTGARSSG